MLTVADWQALAVKAAELGCLPSGGRTPNRPSVVTMLRHIARGKLEIRRP